MMGWFEVCYVTMHCCRQDTGLRSADKLLVNNCCYLHEARFRWLSNNRLLPIPCLTTSPVKLIFTKVLAHLVSADFSELSIVVHYLECSCVFNSGLDGWQKVARGKSVCTAQQNLGYYAHHKVHSCRMSLDSYYVMCVLRQLSFNDRNLVG